MGFQALRGTTDLFADEVERWAAVEQTVRHVARLYGYQELRTPIMEDAALFLRSIGETTDIVQKEMFRFQDRGGHEIVLRPEGTAAVVRAYLEGHLHKTQGFAKFLYLGPMFRAERPQAGRFRQFHQYGVEAIGSSSPWVDVEVIALCLDMLRACGVKNCSLWISSMGSRDDQQRSAQALRERLAPQKAKLCKECQTRFDKNVFRVLDCNNPQCHTLAWETTAVQEARGHFASPFLLTQDSRARFDEVRQGLRSLGIAFDDTQVFARGLDYYTHTVFEVRAQGLGAKDAVAAGGRYDHLVEELGGPAVGAVGFAAGIERVLMAVDKSPATRSEAPTRRGVLYLAVAKPVLLSEGFRRVQQSRGLGVQTIMNYDGKSLKAQLREADRLRCRFVTILGDAELNSGKFVLKDFESGKEGNYVPFEQLVEEITQPAKPSCQ